MIRKLTVIISLFLAITYNSLWAYDGEVHKKIDEYAAKPGVSELDSVLKTQLGMDEGIDTELKGKDANGKEITQEIWKWIAYGGAAEDYGIKIWGVGDKWYNIPCTRGYNHFHDPLKNWDEAGFDKPGLNDIYRLCYGRYPISSILWGLDPERQDFPQNTTGDWSWQKSREYYYNTLTGTTNAERDENFADCFRALGQVMHLLQDASVPLHTRNDFHTPFIDNFETYTLENKKFLNYSAHPPDPVLLTEPQPQSNYSHLVPISGLFDRNQYNEGDPIPVNNNILGLAEYSNANFLTEDTMWDYQHPMADTNYDRIDWLNPEPVHAEDGKVDNRIYIKKDVGEQIDHLAAIKYWAFQLMMFYTPEIHHAFYLDEKCWKDYADKLIPRAVGYSAGLLDYFFRGAIEITAPDKFIYSIIDGRITPQQFTHIKAKLRNTTTEEEMGSGTLLAVAKYKKRTDYQPDLSTDPPTEESREEHFSYSVSEPIAITELSSTEPAEFLFNFIWDPIPAGITDLYLQVVFKGTLGNEPDTAIAVGMKDINEPQHIIMVNSTDRVYLDGVLRTADEIRTNPDLDWPLDDSYLDPYNDMDLGMAFFLDSYPTQLHTAGLTMPAPSYGRVIILADEPSFNFHIQWSSISREHSGYGSTSMAGIVNQENSEGVFQNTQVKTFRGITAHFVSGWVCWYSPDAVGIESANWPAITNDPLPLSIWP